MKVVTLPPDLSVDDQQLMDLYQRQLVQIQRDFHMAAEPICNAMANIKRAYPPRYILMPDDNQEKEQL